MTLLARLFLLVFLAVLPGLALQLHGVYQQRAERERDMADSARQVLHLVEGEQVRLVESARQLLYTIAEAAFLRNGETGRCQDFLVRAAARIPGYQPLSVVSDDGVIVCSGDPEMVGARIAADSVVRRAMHEGGFVLGEWTRWPAREQAVLPLAVPYVDRQGRPAGAVVMTLGLRWLREELAARPLPDMATLTVADRNGTVLVRLPSETPAAGTRLPPAYGNLLHGDTPGVVDMAGLDGRRRVVAYSPVGHDLLGLFIAVGIDHGAGMSAIASATAQAVTLTAAGTVLAVVAAWIGGIAFIRRPVEALARAAEGWRDGNPAIRAGLRDTTSEIGRLGATFDTMAETLEAREEALRASERHLRAVLDSLPFFVAVLRPDGTLLQVNRVAQEALGPGIAAGVGERFEGAGWWPESPPTRVRVRAAIEHAALGRPSRFDAEIRVCAGTIVADVTVTPMTGADGRVTHLIVAATDVTARRRTEDALRLAEERVRTALRNLRVSVANQDRDLRYTWLHDPVLGLALRDARGRTDADLFADQPATAERLMALKRRVIETGHSAREEIAIRRDGIGHWFDLTVDPQRDRDHRIVGITCAAIDVTHRRRGEDAIRTAREEAERANLAKTKFLAAASHDLRQPVQSLYLFAAALRSRLEGPEGQETLPLLDNVDRSLDTLKQLLDSLLDISRLDSGRIAAEPRDVPLGNLLDRLAAEYAPRAAERGLALAVVPTSLRCRTDPALLERILRNLVENALRYTEHGRILIGARRRSGMVRLEVWDTGVGIPAHRLDDIFEEFTQLDPAERRTGEGRGLGLGLAIVKRLSRLLRHRIAVRSHVGHGSVFSVELPLAGAALPAAPFTVGVPANDGDSKGLVLVIDDEAIILLGLKTMLEGWGYDVLTAGSCAQALDRLRGDGRCPRIILADYQLTGGETGPEALAAIQATLASAVPGVILTGDTTPERLQEARRSGYRMLHKPVFPSDLRKLMTMAGAA